MKLTEAQILQELSAKETALCLWAIARLKINDNQIISLFMTKVRRILTSVINEPYLFDAEDNTL